MLKSNLNSPWEATVTLKSEFCPFSILNLGVYRLLTAVKNVPLI